MGTLGAAVKTGFDVKRGVRGSHHRRNNGPRVTFIMTIAGLLSHPIEVEVSSFWFGSSTAICNGWTGQSVEMAKSFRNWKRPFREPVGM